MRSTPLESASWIWKQSGHGPEVDLYLCFRREWNREGWPGEPAFVDLSVDSDFLLMLNGIELGRGQFPDFPRRKTWSRFDATPYLRNGKNVVSILVFYRGEDFSEYARGPGGLLFALQAGQERLVSDETWRYSLHEGYESGVAERVTGQAGFTFRYDARKEVPWTEGGFDDRHWRRAVVTQAAWRGGELWPDVVERPLPPLMLGECLPVRIAAQGRVLPGDSVKEESVASQMASRALQPLAARKVFGVPELTTLPKRSMAFPNAAEWLGPWARGPLPVSVCGGWYIIIDLQAEVVGFLTLEVTAPAGTVLEVAHGEHLEDGRVRMEQDGRRFADRYICGGGRRSFEMPFRRIGARYLELHGSGSVQLHECSLRPVSSRCNRAGAFHVDDPFARRLHEVAVRTLELCRHDHFEDCPWRERALYAFDARLQGLYGYYVFDGYRFAEVSLALLGESYSDEDGVLSLTAPGKRGSVIPGFSFHWVCAVAEHWLYSGKPLLFHRFRREIEGILKHAFARCDEGTGLYTMPSCLPYWHFYEWSDGLSGENVPFRLDSGYQLLLHGAARAFQWMLEMNGEGEAALAIDKKLAALRSALLRNSSRGDGLASFLPDHGQRHEWVRTLAALEGIGEGDEKRQANEEEIPVMLANLFFVLQAVATQEPDRLPFMAQRLQSDWEAMLFSGATSLWETGEGARDFCDGGSLCHGWSALPAYYHGALILGIMPLEPGFRRFRVRVFPDRFQRASGSVPTPHGLIQISWERTPQGLEIMMSGPEGCQPVPESFPGNPVASLYYNGAELLISSGR